MTLTTQQYRDESIRLIDDIIKHEAPFNVAHYYDGGMHQDDIAQGMKTQGISSFQLLHNCESSACFLGYAKLDPIFGPETHSEEWATLVDLPHYETRQMLGFSSTELYSDDEYFEYSDVTPQQLKQVMQQLFDKNPL